MKDLSHGVAVSLFDQQLPKILSDVTSYVVVQKHFNQVKTHKEWAEPQTGFRDHLKIDLETFELAHIQLVTDNTQPSSALQAAPPCRVHMHSHGLEHSSISLMTRMLSLQEPNFQPQGDGA
jgi:hypothetical protein